MRCPNCEHEISDTARFCADCGARLDQEPQNPPADSAHFRALLDSGRYAAVLSEIPDGASADLAPLRAEAQRGFDQSVEAMVSLYRERYRNTPPTQSRSSSLVLAYHEKIPAGSAIDDPFEMNAYVVALLSQAKRLITEGADPDLARTTIYAAQVLPEQQHATTIENLLATLEALAPSEDIGESGNGVEHRAVATPIASEQDFTAPPDLPPADQAMATPDLGDAELAMVEDLERLINDRAELPKIAAQLDAARTLIDADSPYQKRLKRAEGQYEALRSDVPVLNQLLEQAPAEWLASGPALEEQTAAALARIEAVFDGDAPLVQSLRERRRRQLSERDSLAGQLAELDRLEGQPLDEQLQALEQKLPADHPQLAGPRQRRDTYLKQREEAARQEGQRRLLVEQRERIRILRLDLDNLYLDLQPDPQQLVAQRNQAAAATDLQIEDNPLDQASFAYYDLLFASRYRSLTRPSAKVEQGQTLVGMGELVQAYKLLVEAYAEVKDGEDADAKVSTWTELEKVTQLLREKLVADTEATLAAADELLVRFDYQAAQQNLQAQRARIVEAEIGIDDPLERRLQEAEVRVEGLAKRDQQARELFDAAEVATPPTGDAPDFPRALTLLDQGAGIAPWLEPEVKHRRDQLQERRAQFIAGRIQRANIVRQGGAEEDFVEAERLLGQAEANVFDRQQREEIGKLRGTIIQQQQNRQRLQDMLGAARKFADEAKQGSELELLAARVAAERDRIGPRETPNVDSSTWTELNGYLSAAENRIAAWRLFRDLVSQAEQAAFLGDRPAAEGLIKKLTAMSEHAYLPFKESITRINAIARQGSKLDRARRMIDEVREDLANNESKVTADRIYKVFSNTQDLNDDKEVAEDRVFLSAILPLYQARDDLSTALGRGDFTAFDQLYGALAAEIQRSPTIGGLKQQADIARARSSFDQEYQVLMRRVRLLFSSGWDQPQGFQEAVGLIRTFAERAPAGLRDEQERLNLGVIDQLDSLSDTLISARADHDNFRYEPARRRVQTIINDIPLSATSAKNLLGCYTTDLNYLRNVLVGIDDHLLQKKNDGDTQGQKFRDAVGLYVECAGDERRAFRKSDLIKAQNQFTLIHTPEHQAQCDRYIATIKQIMNLIDLVDATEDLMIDGQMSDESAPSGPTPVARSGLQRRKLVEAHLATILERSKAIGETPEGVAWRGIQDDPKYRALRGNLDLAKTLGDADDWLRRTKNLDQGYNDLRNLRGDADDLKALNLPGDRGGALTQAGLTRLVDVSGERWLEVNARLGRVNGTIRQIAQRRRRMVVGVAALLAVIGGVAGGSRVPAVRHPVIVALIGTLTPVPSPVLTATISSQPTAVVVTATPVPTVTPTPTPTPVPPQSGVVIVPGTANVRARPTLEEAPLSNVTAGDDVLVTGYSVEPDGTVWYRIDVPNRNLRDVWLRAQVSVQGRTFESVRLDNDATLDPALRLPYNL